MQERPWFHFEDEPRSMVNGITIEKFLKNKEDMIDDFGHGVVRLLRRDEEKRPVNEDGKCLYVLHDWHQKVLEPNAPVDECERIFLGLDFPYNIEDCGRLVIFMKEGDNWAALSVMLKRAITYLIHPACSGSDPEEVMGKYRPLMEQLTIYAVGHMRKLANTQILNEKWVSDIALKEEHVMDGPDTGITTAYYSVPKNNQFMIIGMETIYLAKLTFLYEGIKFCYKVTHKKVQKGHMPGGKKRNRGGKFRAYVIGDCVENSEEKTDEKSDDNSDEESEESSQVESVEGSTAGGQ